MTVDKKVEAEIDALLACNDQASVIDTLLSMPHAMAADDPAWEKLMHARLQERLARKMRDMLEGAEERKDSRSAA
ncbi:hypothetical protein [Chelativorans sp. AA-79]|uniref:hypothetical protein n=1 Tax=Chelativorans sp. AA-79 TaxID=3028735 RepID=UPI0023F86942|nr:hypothetical protein [Chelativorans sp. AA-79]WEX10174.1 hypothetical protein PVE73_04225 [Chelativorans sp. AA-79]